MKALTIRARLTLVYVALMILAGGLLVGATYVLVSQGLERQVGPPPPPPFDAPAPGVPPTPEQIAEFRRYADDFRDGVRDSALTSVLTRGTIALVVVVVAVSALSWILAGRALRPLNRITATARRIAGGPAGSAGLHERISLRGPQDEVKELADTFDDMLGRLDRSFEAQRRFVANASHELRTPLALNRSMVEVAITRPDASADLQVLGTKLLAVNDRHVRLVEALLALAESETVTAPRAPVDLAGLVDRALEAADPGELTVRADLGTAVAHGDSIMLERVVANLLDNAIRHNVPAGWIEVRSESDAGVARLTVRNSSTPVSLDDAAAIFEPFRRLRTARTGTGFGLGLSIVRVIVQAHRGTVRAAPLGDGGLEVVVDLPLCTDKPRQTGRPAAL